MRYFLAGFTLLLLLGSVPASSRPAEVYDLTPDSTLVDLHCNGTRLSDVLQKLAHSMKRNLIVSPGVEGTVTADLHQVPAMHALGMVLQMQKADYRWKMVGNTIVVGTPERLRKIPDNIMDPHRSPGGP